MNVSVGIDIGGTKTAIGIVDKSGHVIDHLVIPTAVNVSPAEMIDIICKETQALITNQEPLNIEGIGIGVPGPLDVNKGVVHFSPNLPQWHEVNIVEQMKEFFQVPVYLENDANVAALAEGLAGAAKGCTNFIYMTISTGIGAGFYINGKLVSGASGNAGEIGHMVVDPSFGTCSCGQKGCFEHVASGQAIARLGSEIIGNKITAKEVFDLYRKGHQEIQALVDRVFTNIGICCVSLINMIEPEKIIIGGGIAQVGEPLFSAVEHYVKKYALSPIGRQTKIVSSGLKQQSGIIGAAALVQ